MAKKKLKETKEEAVFFVGMKDPMELRRSILESSKELLQYLQRTEKFKQVRKEKTAEIAKLKSIMKEINSLSRKLKQSLPKTGLRAAKPKLKVEASKPITEPEVQQELPVEPPKEMNELERLESELNEIEDRLGKLD